MYARSVGSSSIARAVARACGERLRERFGERVVDVRLFGSYARGEADEDSDIDLLVLIAELTNSDKIEAIELCSEVSLQTGLNLSPLVMSPPELDRLRMLEARLALDIDREGIPL
jgi:predicted nucleotidyltransferase